MNHNTLPVRSILSQLLAVTSAACLIMCAIAVTARSCNAAPSAQLSRVVTCDEDVIYIYVDGMPLAQPTDSVQEGGVYTDADVFVGTVDPNTNNILDANENVIGYVQVMGQPEPDGTQIRS
jgi:hypothetical protein